MLSNNFTHTPVTRVTEHLRSLALKQNLDLGETQNTLQVPLLPSTHTTPHGYLKDERREINDR